MRFYKDSAFDTPITWSHEQHLEKYHKCKLKPDGLTTKYRLPSMVKWGNRKDRTKTKEVTQKVVEWLEGEKERDGGKE